MKKLAFFGYWIVFTFFGFLYQLSPETSAKGIMGEWWMIVLVSGIAALTLVALEILLERLSKRLRSKKKTKAG